MDPAHDQVKAGLFVVITGALAIAVVFVLADLGRFASSPRTVVAEFSLDEGVAGLRRGATVTVGGEPAGRVTRIEDVRKDGRLVAKRVRFTLPRKYEIAQNAVVELKRPLLGSGARLNLPGLGDGAPYEPGTPLEGVHGSLAVAKHALREAGIGPKEKKAIGEIVADARKVASTLRERLPAIADKLDAVLADAQKAVKDVKAVAGRFEGASGKWKKRIDRVTASAAKALERVQKIVKEKGPAIRSAVDDVKSVAKRARKKIAPKLASLLEKGEAAAADLKKTTEDVKAMIAGKRPAIERTVDNVATTSEQLKLASIEIRHSPWRLLYEPSKKELRSQNIYDAARSFALGASALRTAAEHLHALEKQAEGDEKRIAKIEKHLQNLFRRFRKAEKGLWKALGRPAGESGQ